MFIFFSPLSFRSPTRSLPFPVPKVPLYAVLLFGPKVVIDHQRGLQSGTDGWVLMRAWPRIGVLVNSLRTLFDADLEANIEEPSWEGTSSISFLSCTPRILFSWRRGAHALSIVDRSDESCCAGDVGAAGEGRRTVLNT